jgi:hypothetical protein
MSFIHCFTQRDYTTHRNNQANTTAERNTWTQAPWRISEIITTPHHTTRSLKSIEAYQAGAEGARARTKKEGKERKGKKGKDTKRLTHASRHKIRIIYLS